MSSTHERLRKAEAVFQKRIMRDQENGADQDDGCHSSEFMVKRKLMKILDIQISDEIEKILKKVGLGIDRISEKSLDELKNTIVMANAYIQKPDIYLNIKNDEVSDKKEIENKIMVALIERKKLVLERYCTLITMEKIQKIRKMIGSISNKKCKQGVERILNQLIIKDQFILDELMGLSELYLLTLLRQLR